MNAWTKFGIVCFISYAIYAANSQKINSWVDNATNIFNPDSNVEVSRDSDIKKETLSNQKHGAVADTEEELAAFQITTKNDDSMVSNFIVRIINKVLENPHGRAIFKEIANNMVKRYHGLTGEDIANKDFIVKDINVINPNATQAACGNKVKIEYSVTESESLNSGVNSPNLKITETLSIGEFKLNKNLENGIIGMTLGGTRKVIYGKPKTEKSANDKQKYLVADVKLLDLFAKPTKPSNAKVYIEKHNYPAQIFGSKIICGNNIPTSYKVLDVTGKTLYDSKDISFAFDIGINNTPDIISNALIDMVKGKTQISIIAKIDEIQHTNQQGKRLIPESIVKKHNLQNKLLILEITA